jgi:hypothetical protein
VRTERPRAPRYLFVATIELTDTQSEAKIQERTSDLSLTHLKVSDIDSQRIVVHIRGGLSRILKTLLHKGRPFILSG